MQIDSLIRQRRSIRRFQNRPLDPAMLTELVDLARLHASGGNLQPIRYAVVCRQPLLGQVFDCFRWAMYLPGFSIAPEERPQAFVLLYADTAVRQDCQFDAGAAATTLMLAAQARGVASCCLGSADRDRLNALLRPPEGCAFLLGIALGYPAQESEEAPFEGSVRYFEEGGRLRVPKRGLADVLNFSDAEA